MRTLRSRSTTTRVEESPLHERRSKTRASPGGGAFGSGLAGSRSRSSVFTREARRALGVGLEVGAGGVGDLAAVARLARHLDGRPEGVVAQAARGVLGHERAVGRERVLAVARRVEALGHLPVQRAGGDERVVAVAGPGDSAPRPCGSAGRPSPTPSAGPSASARRAAASPRLRLAVERRVRARRGRRGGRLARVRLAAVAVSGSSRAAPARGEAREVPSRGAQRCQVSTVS